MGFEPAEILFLDDTRENIVGALESGLQARWVRNEAEVVQVLDEIKTGPGG
jgi:FMN phosphatase YigB (HAD superfamily)